MKGLKHAASGTHCDVWMVASVTKAIRKAPADDRARMKKLIGHLAQYGQEDFNKTQFRHEGKYATGNPGEAKKAVYAFKAYQLRVYGGYCRMNGETTFVCTHGVIKKDDGADQALLRGVARKLGEYDDG